MFIITKIRIILYNLFHPIVTKFWSNKVQFDLSSIKKIPYWSFCLNFFPFVIYYLIFVWPSMTHIYWGGCHLVKNYIFRTDFIKIIIICMHVNMFINIHIHMFTCSQSLTFWVTSLNDLLRQNYLNIVSITTPGILICKFAMQSIKIYYIRIF